MTARSVLIVDDDVFIRKLIATTLEDVGGFSFRQAGDGVEALAEAERHRPAIVFIDFHMPNMDGIEAVRRMRAGEAAREATIVMLTAAGGDYEDEARAAGVDLFLTKPFSPLELLRLVDRIGATP